MNSSRKNLRVSPIFSEFFLEYSEKISKILKTIDLKKMESVIDCFLEARKSGRTIWFAGNGGSAATASHFAEDLASQGLKGGGKTFKTRSMADNVPLITAISNDFGYENIFSFQIGEAFEKGDVLVLISASGNSPNVVKAACLAKRKKGFVVALVGFDGGKLKKICDHVIHVETEKNEYGPVEDVHLILEHMITAFTLLKIRKGKMGS